MSDTAHKFQIAVTKTTGPLGHLIDDVTDGPFTHCYIIDEFATYSMEPDGLHKRPFDFWGTDNPTSQFDLTWVQQAKLAAFVAMHAGITPYDFIGDGIVGLDDLTPTWLDPLWRDLERFEDAHSPAWFCSAFAVAALRYAGVTILPDRPAHSITPMDLYHLFTQEGWVLTA